MGDYWHYPKNGLYRNGILDLRNYDLINIFRVTELCIYIKLVEEEMKKLFILICLMQFVFGCTWVELTDEGKAIRVVKLEDVANCKQTGKVLVKLKDKVAGFDRDEEKVRHELENLARNMTVELKMEGDTIVPISPIEGGKQSFAVYKCINPGGTE